MIVVLGIALAVAVEPMFGVPMGLMGLILLAYGLTQRGTGGRGEKPGPTS